MTPRCDHAPVRREASSRSETVRREASSRSETVRRETSTPLSVAQGNIYCDLQHDSAYIPTKMERNLLFLAYRLSLESNNKNGRHAAIIIDEQDNILSVGVNKLTQGVSMHAEVSALIQLRNFAGEKRTEGGTAQSAESVGDRTRMLVVRGNFFGDFTHSKPCLNCYNSVMESGIGQIIYSVSNNEYRKIKLRKAQ